MKNDASRNFNVIPGSLEAVDYLLLTKALSALQFAASLTKWDVSDPAVVLPQAKNEQLILIGKFNFAKSRLGLPDQSHSLRLLSNRIAFVPQNTRILKVAMQ